MHSESLLIAESNDLRYSCSKQYSLTRYAEHMEVPVVETMSCKPEGRGFYFQVSLGLFFGIIFPAALRSWDRLRLLTPMSARNIHWGRGGKGGQCLWLTFPPSCVSCLEIWKLHLPRTLSVCRILNRHCCACYYDTMFLFLSIPILGYVGLICFILSFIIQDSVAHTL
jgi:hypothetical protein